MAAVWNAIESALSKGAQSANKDVGEDCALLLEEMSDWRPESGELMAALYEYQRRAFIEMIADSVEAICRAATAALKPVLSENFMQEAYNICGFLKQSNHLQDCLDKVHSSSVLTGLQEAAEKGVATMRGTCAEHGLEKEVAFVYKALEEALCLADVHGYDLKLLQRYCAEGEVFMKDLCANDRKYLIHILAWSMQLIAKAAARALEVRQPQTKPW